MKIFQSVIFSIVLCSFFIMEESSSWAMSEEAALFKCDQTVRIKGKQLETGKEIKLILYDVKDSEEMCSIIDVDFEDGSSSVELEIVSGKNPRISYGGDAGEVGKDVLENFQVEGKDFEIHGIHYANIDVITGKEVIVKGKVVRILNTNVPFLDE